MKKLDKTAIAERDEIAGRLRDKYSDLEKAVDDFNHKMGEAWAKVAEAIEHYNATLDDEWGNMGMEEALNNYNEAVADANAWKQGVAQEIQDYIDERSDKWRESEACARYEAWKEPFDEEIQAAEIERPEELQLEEPEELLLEDIEDPAEGLEGLPEELDAGF